METKTKPVGQWPEVISKWWKTESAQAAQRRAEERKREKIAKLRADLAARKEAIKAAADAWKVVE
jgi:hypothetical protein